MKLSLSVFTAILATTVSASNSETVTSQRILREACLRRYRDCRMTEGSEDWLNNCDAEVLSCLPPPQRRTTNHLSSSPDHRHHHIHQTVINRNTGRYSNPHNRISYDLLTNNLTNDFSSPPSDTSSDAINVSTEYSPPSYYDSIRNHPSDLETYLARTQHNSVFDNPSSNPSSPSQSTDDNRNPPTRPGIERRGSADSACSINSTGNPEYDVLEHGDALGKVEFLRHASSSSKVGGGMRFVKRGVSFHG